jgi:general secretion pathway protein C
LVDLFRHFHWSLSDLRGLVSRRTVILALMAVFLYQGVGIFYKALTLQIISMKPAPAAEVKAPPTAAAAREPAEAYRIIPERNLFGTTNKAVAEKQAGQVQQQDIALLIDLRGTVAGDSKYGFAIVEEKGTRKQRLVKAGDVIAGAKVVRIKRNAMDILVEDQERTLKIAETREAPILPPPAAGASASSLPTPLPTPSGPIPSGAVVLNRSEIGAGFQDMGSMLRQAQVRPYFNAGVPDGFMVSSIQAGSLYQKMGIVDGDIIQGINNRPIRTADDMMELYNVMKSGPGMALSIKRRGNPETLNFQFR